MKLRMKIAAGAAAAALSIAALAFNAAGINASLDSNSVAECSTDQSCQQGYWSDANNEWYPYYQQYLGEYWYYYGSGLCNYWEYEQLCSGLLDDVQQLYAVTQHIAYEQSSWQ